MRIRVDRFDFEAMGRDIWENAPGDSWWIVRGERKLFGRRDEGFKMLYAKRIMRLDAPQEVRNAA